MREAHDAIDPPAAWRAMSVAVRNIGRDGTCGDGDLGGRHGDLGSEGEAARIAARDAARRGVATPCRSTAAAASRAIPTTSCASSSRGWVERDGCRWVKMKIGTRAGARSAPGARGEARDRRRARCSSTPTAPIACKQALASRGRIRRRGGRTLVRGAGLVRRSRRPAPCARARAGGNGDRCGRIRLHTDYFRRMLAARAPSTCSRRM